MKDGSIEGIGVVLVMLGCLASLPFNPLIVLHPHSARIWEEFSDNVLQDAWSQLFYWSWSREPRYWDDLEPRPQVENTITLNPRYRRNASERDRSSLVWKVQCV
jgi:hypothetical protein